MPGTNYGWGRRLRMTASCASKWRNVAIAATPAGAGNSADQNEKAAPGRCLSCCFKGPISGLGHRDLDAADFALRVDLYVLLVAVGPQIQVRGETGSLDEHVDLAAAGGTLQIAEDIPALFAPVAGDPVTLAGDVAGEIEFIAVAGAVQVLLQAEPAGVDLVVGLAADVFGGAVGERDCAGAAPVSVKAGERAS